MQQLNRHMIYRRMIASVVLLAYLASCTHMPSGQKAFENFDQCIAANLGLAAAGGLAIGALGKSLAKQITGDKRTQNAVGVTAGVAAAVMIGLTAWRKCAAVYNTSEPIVQAASTQPPPPQAVQRRMPGLDLERLDVRVEGTENDPPVPEFDFSFIAENAAAKDIKARFRHKVEIVSFKADDNDKLILADAKGEPLRDSAGRHIPLEAAMRMPRERLHWVTIAEEGKDDYVEDVIIQQGPRASFRHKLQIPPRAQLPLPLPVPMRYTVTVEADAFKSARTVDFALLGTGERPKRFTAAAAAVNSTVSSVSPATPPASGSVAPAPRSEEQRPPSAPGPEPQRAALPPRPEAQRTAPAPRPDAQQAMPAPRPEPQRAAPAPRPEPQRVAPPPRPEEPKVASAPRPEDFKAAPAPRPEAQRAAPAVAENFFATHTLRRDTVVYDEASTRRNSTGRLNRGTPVRIEEPAGFNVTNRPQVWVKIGTRTGTAGWLQAGELEEIK